VLHAHSSSRPIVNHIVVQTHRPGDPTEVGARLLAPHTPIMQVIVVNVPIHRMC
jgi:hypothetical protein